MSSIFEYDHEEQRHASELLTGDSFFYLAFGSEVVHRFYEMFDFEDETGGPYFEVVPASDDFARATLKQLRPLPLKCKDIK